MKAITSRILILLILLLFSCKDAVEIQSYNILLICVDDLRPELKSFGVEYISSPNIDKLSESGISFRKHFVNAPSCGPSRYAMLTGQYGPRDNNALFQRADKIRKGEKVEPSMPKWFRTHGYTTVSVGKVSHHPGGLGGPDWNDTNIVEMPDAWNKQLIPVAEWEHPRGIMHGLANGEIRRVKNEMDVFQSIDGNDNIYPDGIITDEATKQLKQLVEDQETPFFLAVGLIKPHLPFGAPKKYLDRYQDVELPKIDHPHKPEGKTTWHGSGEFNQYNRWDKDPNTDQAFADELRRHYAACVSYADANDYLTKPFSKVELLSRIKTHLNLHRIHKSTGKFVPYEFLRAVGRESITDVQLGDHIQKEVTVFFSDIRNFTTFSEKMSPQDNFEFINRYVGVMGPIVRKYDGFINQFQGDGIMAVFPKESDWSLKAAIDMQKATHKFNESEEIDITVGMGMQTGPLVMGIIGDEERNKPTTIADTVNAASRMEGLTKYYGAKIIVTDNCINALEKKEDFNFRSLGKVQVKGRVEFINAYECFDGDSEEVRSKKLELMDQYILGLEHFFNKEFGDAMLIFSRIVKENPSDLVSECFRKKSAQYSFQGVLENWTGVEEMQGK